MYAAQYNGLWIFLSLYAAAAAVLRPEQFLSRHISRTSGDNIIKSPPPLF